MGNGESGIGNRGWDVIGWLGGFDRFAATTIKRFGKTRPYDIMLPLPIIRFLIFDF